MTRLYAMAKREAAGLRCIAGRVSGVVESGIDDQDLLCSLRAWCFCAVHRWPSAAGNVDNLLTARGVLLQPVYLCRALHVQYWTSLWGQRLRGATHVPRVKPQLMNVPMVVL